MAQCVHEWVQHWVCLVCASCTNEVNWKRKQCVGAQFICTRLKRMYIEACFISFFVGRCIWPHNQLHIYLSHTWHTIVCQCKKSKCILDKFHFISKLVPNVNSIKLGNDPWSENDSSRIVIECSLMNRNENERDRKKLRKNILRFDFLACGTEKKWEESWQRVKWAINLNTTACWNDIKKHRSLCVSVSDTSDHGTKHQFSF